MNKQTVDQVKRTLRMSTGEGMAFGAFLGFGDHFIMAFAVAAGTESLYLGLLASIPGVLASLAQLFDTRLVRLLKSRKSVILVFTFAQALMFVPLIILAVGDVGHRGWWLVASATLYSIFGALVSPAWGSLMAEVVPDSMRGKYFSMRGRFSTLATVVTFLLAGVFLNALAQKQLWAFAMLFGAAIVARLLSWFFLTRLYEMPRSEAERLHSRAGQFVRDLPSTNLGKYLIFLFAMSFAVNIASPYFPVFELRDLKMSYFTFVGLETVSSLATLLALTHWGQAADRAGNRRMLMIASWSISFVPLLWLISQNTGYLGVAQVFSGLAWAGFNLCSVNYLFDATTHENRTRYLAYFNAGNGLAAGGGALLGAFLSTRLPGVGGYQILTLFLISGVMRLLVSFTLLPTVKEVRRVADMPAVELFHILMGGRPVMRRISHRRTIHVHDHDGPGVSVPATPAATGSPAAAAPAPVSPGTTAPAPNG